MCVNRVLLHFGGKAHHNCSSSQFSDWWSFFLAYSSHHHLEMDSSCSDAILSKLWKLSTTHTTFIILNDFCRCFLPVSLRPPLNVTWCIFVQKKTLIYLTENCMTSMPFGSCILAQMATAIRIKQNAHVVMCLLCEEVN